MRSEFFKEEGTSLLRRIFFSKGSVFLEDSSNSNLESGQLDKHRSGKIFFLIMIRACMGCSNWR